MRSRTNFESSVTVRRRERDAETLNTAAAPRAAITPERAARGPPLPAVKAPVPARPPVRSAASGERRSLPWLLAAALASASRFASSLRSCSLVKLPEIRRYSSQALDRATSSRRPWSGRSAAISGPGAKSTPSPRSPAWAQI